MPVAQILPSLGLSCKLFRRQVVASHVFTDQEILHQQDHDATKSQDAGTDGVTLHIPMGRIRCTVDLPTNGTSNVAKGDNGGRGNSALGMTADIRGEPTHLMTNKIRVSCWVVELESKVELLLLPSLLSLFFSFLLPWVEQLKSSQRRQ